MRINSVINAFFYQRLIVTYYINIILIVSPHKNAQFCVVYVLETDYGGRAGVKLFWSNSSFDTIDTREFITSN